jgi:RNA polymerase sigma factor (sigma-70 family)
VRVGPVMRRNRAAANREMDPPSCLGANAATDFELLALWRSGDNCAGSTLAKRHLDPLHRFFLRRARGHEDDLVQQTFAACVEGRDAFRGESSFRAYLFGIARFQLVSHYRHEYSRPVLDFMITSSEDGSAAGALSEPDEGPFLKLALLRIPALLRIALELTYWQDLTAPEVAEILGIPENTVYSRLRRGKAQLRNMLDRH